jgi:quinol-cytochrome oxidoreductase complex cytochrome b subunit
VDAPATYLQWGFIIISVPNLLLILGMVALFVIAILAPFARHRAIIPAPPRSIEPASPEEAAEGSNWTRSLRLALTRRWPAHLLLPDRQPSFVSSWVYVFGVCAIAALIWIVGSGLVLVFFGPAWWHETTIGRLVNSIHFWSVQVFFAAMVLHLWGQYLMASWRHGRSLTWIAGVVTFAVSIAAAFTGYLSQQNLDAQWIALNGKDAINSTGLGSFFNILDFGQMYGIHVVLLPLVVGSLVVVHIALVRLRGVVRPIDSPPPDEAAVPTKASPRASAAKPEASR